MDVFLVDDAGYPAHVSTIPLKASFVCPGAHSSPSSPPVRRALRLRRRYAVVAHSIFRFYTISCHLSLYLHRHLFLDLLRPYKRWCRTCEIDLQSHPCCWDDFASAMSCAVLFWYRGHLIRGPGRVSLSFPRSIMLLLIPWLRRASHAHNEILGDAMQSRLCDWYQCWVVCLQPGSSAYYCQSVERSGLTPLS